MMPMLEHDVIREGEDEGDEQQHNGEGREMDTEDGAKMWDHR